MVVDVHGGLAGFLRLNGIEQRLLGRLVHLNGLGEGFHDIEEVEAHILHALRQVRAQLVQVLPQGGGAQAVGLVVQQLRTAQGQHVVVRLAPEGDEAGGAVGDGGGEVHLPPRQVHAGGQAHAQPLEHLRLGGVAGELIGEALNLEGHVRPDFFALPQLLQVRHPHGVGGRLIGPGGLGDGLAQRRLGPPQQSAEEYNNQHDCQYRRRAGAGEEAQLSVPGPDGGGRAACRRSGPGRQRVLEHVLGRDRGLRAAGLAGGGAAGGAELGPVRKLLSAFLTKHDFLPPFRTCIHNR